ncbi:MAG: hybrid sensor histidine kinase/response regulator, partial [Bacteroidia bacterium]
NNSPILLAYGYLLKAEISINKLHYDRAYENTLKALVFLQEQNDLNGQLKVYDLLSRIYYQQSKYALALDCARKYWVKAKNVNNTSIEAKALIAMALPYGNLNKKDSAEWVIGKAYELSKGVGLTNTVKVFETRYKLSEIYGDPVGALHYYKKYSAFSDSLKSANKAREIAQLEAVKENEKQRDLNKVLVQKAQKQANTIEQKEFEKRIYLFGLLLVILLCLLAIYSWYRAKQANKKLLKLTHDIKQSRDKIKSTSEKLKDTNKKLVKIQAALISQKDTAQRASKAKDVFLSSVTHELRTPLTAILGLSEEMLAEAKSSQARENLEIIKFSGENLLSLVNDILDYNKIQSGRIELEYVSFNLERHFEKMVKALKPKARQNKVELEFKYDSALPKYFLADPVRLGQVINNFLSNAIKFTENGKVSLLVNEITNISDSYTIRIAVKDQGIGIPDNKVEHIFERFTQASTDTTRKYGGTGLGLAISKRIVELYGSKIKVESKMGVGSVFYFDIELDKGDKEEITEDDGVANVPSEINILVVEDNKINQKLISKTFSTMGIDIDIANHGIEALELVKSNLKEYDVILMDMHMPKMDGPETTKRIRLMGGYLQNIPIIGLSGSTIKEGKELLEMGLSAFMQKPFKKDELLKLIAEQIVKV